MFVKNVLVAVAAATLCGGHVAAAELASTAGQQAAADLGRQVFTEIAQPPCGACHVLADAGTEGTTGPSLDEQRPSEEDVKLTVTEGPGVMPAYGDLLTEEQIDAVAKYVSSVAGKAD